MTARFIDTYSIDILNLIPVMQYIGYVINILKQVLIFFITFLELLKRK